MTRSELLDVVYRFYPRGMLSMHRRYVPPGEPVYDDTDEHGRLMEAARRGRVEYATWQAMIRRLGDRYGLQNESLHLLAGGVDPAYSARIWLPDDRALTFHVSLLGPYLGIHCSDASDEQEVARGVAQEIEATYPGYQPIPPELGDEVVPDVDVDQAPFGKATIYISLFSQVWTWASCEPATTGVVPDEVHESAGEGKEPRVSQPIRLRFRLVFSEDAENRSEEELKELNETHNIAELWENETVRTTLVESVIEVYEVRFGAVPPELRTAIEGARDLPALRAWHRLAITRPAGEIASAIRASRAS